MSTSNDLAYIIDVYMNATEEQKKKIKELTTALISKPVTTPLVVSDKTYNENFKDAIKKTNEAMEKKRQNLEPLPLVQEKNGTYYPPPLPKKLNEEPLRQVVVQSYNPKCHMHKFRDAVKKCDSCDKCCCITCINRVAGNARGYLQVCDECKRQRDTCNTNGVICIVVVACIGLTVFLIYHFGSN